MNFVLERENPRIPNSFRNLWSVLVGLIFRRLYFVQIYIVFQEYLLYNPNEIEVNNVSSSIPNIIFQIDIELSNTQNNEYNRMGTTVPT